MKLYRLYFKIVLGVFGLLIVLSAVKQCSLYKEERLQIHCKRINYDFTRSAGRACVKVLSIENNKMKFIDLDNKIEIYEIVLDDNQYKYNFIEYQ